MTGSPKQPGTSAGRRPTPAVIPPPPSRPSAPQDEAHLRELGIELDDDITTVSRSDTFQEDSLPEGMFRTSALKSRLKQLDLKQLFSKVKLPRQLDKLKLRQHLNRLSDKARPLTRRVTAQAQRLKPYTRKAREHLRPLVKTPQRRLAVGAAALVLVVAGASSLSLGGGGAITAERTGGEARHAALAAVAARAGEDASTRLTGRARRVRADQLIRRGHAQLRARKAAQAEASFKAALELAPRRQRAHLGLIEALRKQGKDEDALDAAQLLVEARPNSGRAYLALGDAQRRLGNDWRARRAWRKAARLGNRRAKRRLRGPKGKGQLARR